LPRSGIEPMRTQFPRDGSDSEHRAGMSGPDRLSPFPLPEAFSSGRGGPAARSASDDAGWLRLPGFSSEMQRSFGFRPARPRPRSHL